MMSAKKLKGRGAKLISRSGSTSGEPYPSFNLGSKSRYFGCYI